MNGINLLIAGTLTLFAYDFLNAFALLAFLEAAILLLIAGGMDLTSSIFAAKVRQYLLKSDKNWTLDDSRRSQRGARKYIFLGAALLLESILLFLI